MECTKENCLLCRHILPEWRELVKLKRTVLSFKKGAKVFNQGENVKGIYFIMSGKVRIEMKWAEKYYIPRLAKDGDILGHRGLGLDDVYPISATALTELLICFIELKLFKTLLRTNEKLSNELLWFYADELKLTERKMRHLVTMNVKGRIAEALLYVNQVFGNKSDGNPGFEITRKDLAALAGTTYETTIRTLNELVQENIILIVSNSIIILDFVKLNFYCAE